MGEFLRYQCNLLYIEFKDVIKLTLWVDGICELPDKLVLVLQNYLLTWQHCQSDSCESLKGKNLPTLPYYVIAISGGK